MTSFISSKPALGPKEGRLPPGLFSPASAERRRRLTGRRKHVFLFGTVLLMLLAYSTYFRPGVLARFEEFQEVPRHGLMLQNVKSAVSSEDTNKQRDRRSQPSLQKNVQTSNSQQPMRDESTNDEEKLAESTTESIGKQNGYDQKPKPNPGREKSSLNRWAERPNFQADLEAIFAIHPDEIKEREFLRLITNGGPERMKELGLRTRAYQKYLSAWEKLHLVEDKKTGETYVRDDVVQYLRAMQDDDDASPDSSLTNMIHNYEAFRSFLTKFGRILFPFTIPYFADHMTLHSQLKNGGRGIVLTAGDDQAKYLLTTIYTFRKLGCDLPIEVMYLGEEDLGEDYRFELEALPGVTTRDISRMVDDEGWKLAGWAIKPFAMLLSSFREVIFIDADSFFFRDPAKLFDDPDYKKTGALFFRDRTIMPESKRKWLMQILPRPIHKLAKESSWWMGTSGHHQESGVVVIDTWKHFVSMLLICRFNGSDRDPRIGKMGVYEMMHGDKETFWIGFLLAGDPSFAFHRGAVGSIGVIEPANTTTTTTTESESQSPDGDELPLPRRKAPAPPDEETSTSPPATYTMCNPQLLHLDVDGTPLWFNGWLLASKYAERSKRRFSPMESYLWEPRAKLGDGDDDFWKLALDNVCCLTSDAGSKADLDEGDLDLLKMMRDRALEVGALN
ncbi:glycosyltransferase family 71 protein [Hypoxylon argillaceum]|nr:glycosyltransferase family 71 protein [Hypoxylon argillaceum]